MEKIQVPTSSKHRSVLEPESAAVYSSTMRMHWESNVELLDAFQSAFAPTVTGNVEASGDKLSAARFIDIGCGDGSFTLNYILPRCSSECEELVGVDKSLGMLEYARLHHSHEKIRYLHLDIVESDVDEFVNEHGLFQRVYSFYLLHWITDKDKARAMRNIEKLMAPGGECFIVFDNCIVLHEVLMALADAPRWKKYAETLQEKVPGTARCTDVTFLRSHLMGILDETNLKPLACEVLRLPVVRIPSLKDATDAWLCVQSVKEILQTNKIDSSKLNLIYCIDRLVSYNPIYSLIKDEEKDELIQFTAKILTERAQGIAEGRMRNYRHTFVIHAYKPTL